ncbi:MAG TPA: SMP-30/gluconolactonase/LRE family protein [Vicinamibacterales bacterium]|nr:SMP-30/gluconolactonase/LRE family protein [Vicinamibacterales bacterium]
MLRQSTWSLALAGLLTAGCNTQTPATPASAPAPAAATPAAAAAAAVGKIDRLDPALDSLIAPGAVIEKVADGFKFTEGPLWRPDGTLWFSDVVGNVVRSVTPDGKVTVLIENAGGVSTAPPGSFVGSNGMAEAPDGSVWMVQHTNRQIVRIAPDHTMTPVVSKFEGKRFNSPNDLVFAKDGSLYFTDPPYGLVKQDEDPAKEIKFNGVYRFSNGKVQALVRDLNRPNGLAFSPDFKVLYVNNSDPAKNLVMRYDVAADGTLSGGRVFADMTSKTEGLADGLKVDAQGNVYTTGPGGVWVLSPAGKHLGTIAPPEGPANCGWGDDGKTLYMTANTGIYRIKTLVGK